MSEETPANRDLRNLRRDLRGAYRSVRQRPIVFLIVFALLFAAMIPWVWGDRERVTQITTIQTAKIGGIPVLETVELLKVAQVARNVWRSDALGRFDDLEVVRAAAGVRFEVLEGEGLVILSSQRPEDVDLSTDCVEHIVNEVLAEQRHSAEMVDVKFEASEADGYFADQKSMLYRMIDLERTDRIQVISADSQDSLEEGVDISLLDLAETDLPSGVGIIELYTLWAAEDRDPEQGAVCIIEICMPPRMKSQILEARVISGGGEAQMGIYADVSGDWIKTAHAHLDPTAGTRELIIPDADRVGDGQKIVIQIKPGGNPPILESIALRTSHESRLREQDTIAERAEDLMGVVAQAAVNLARREYRPAEATRSDSHSTRDSTGLVIARLVFTIVFALFGASVTTLMLGFVTSLRNDYTEERS